MKYGYDLTRVKIGCNTHGFFDLNGHNIFSNQLKEFDHEFYNGNLIYTNESLKLLCQELKDKNMYVNIPYTADHFSNQPFNLKMNLIEFIINNSHDIVRYDDTDRFFDYLNLKLMTKWEQYKIHKHPFWLVENDKWNIINLILLEQEDADAICYKMSSIKDKFIISPICYDEMNDYLENYNGEIKNIYRELTRK